MTNSPEIPDSSRASTTTEGEAVPAGAAAVPEAATSALPAEQPESYARLVEPRSENRLALESGVWHQISPKYVTVQLISTGSFLLVVIAATLVLTLLMHQLWAWIPGGILTVILAWTLAILPRQARAIGYQLRDDDLVFRRGILWQRFVAVPYGRMQLIDITHGPLDRGFGIAQLKFVTAAAATGVVIPGLAQSTAETLRDHLVRVAESRRTGL
ncbi:PH domain-containing protein [Microbacterium sp. M3]|uniref:PH domain-containing protein n=1 Tax=Microbacterium arthrosphaerae TaxID=792652 RepID=A0ABU4H2T3_9MICO|nr:MULTISPECIES: PH domain-containing protein [Microbacterium]MDW4573639.1 PH domain-containing protein [Microbacterium arthrosphaerae]MDW7607494.1 PH domain-containing protein [Microbacterium sp. M3]